MKKKNKKWIGLTLILNHVGFSDTPNFCEHRVISMTSQTYN